MNDDPLDFSDPKIQAAYDAGLGLVWPDSVPQVTFETCKTSNDQGERDALKERVRAYESRAVHAEEQVETYEAARDSEKRKRKKVTSERDALKRALKKEGWPKYEGQTAKDFISAQAAAARAWERSKR